jgi:hypothetical protein
MTQHQQQFMTGHETVYMHVMRSSRTGQPAAVSGKSVSGNDPSVLELIEIHRYFGSLWPV